MYIQIPWIFRISTFPTHTVSYKVATKQQIIRNLKMLKKPAVVRNLFFVNYPDLETFNLPRRGQSRAGIHPARFSFPRN